MEIIQIYNSSTGDEIQTLESEELIQMEEAGFLEDWINNNLFSNVLVRYNTDFVERTKIRQIMTYL